MAIKEFICTHYERHRKFFVYSWVGVLFTLLNSAILYVLIDLLRLNDWPYLNTFYISAVVAFVLFVLKYAAYRRSGFA